MGRPQVLVERADGMGHPGTFRFQGLVEEVSNGVFGTGAKPAALTDGMSYSLVSRDILAATVEIHALDEPVAGTASEGAAIT